MVQHTNEFYHAAIKIALPETYEIRTPSVLGMASPVFLATSPQCTHVCKFNDYDIVMHNRKIRDLLADSGFNIPRAQIHMYFDAWFEAYQYHPDKTLYEHIKNGLDNEKITSAYHQAIDKQAKISQTPISCLRNIRPIYYSDVFKTIKRYKMNEPLVSIYGGIIEAASRTSTPHLLHCDLNPRNILTNKNGDVTCLIDLDAVALASDEFALIQMLRTYPFDNIREVIEYYEHATDRTVNHKMVMRAVQILNSMRKQQVHINKMFQRKNLIQK